MKSLFKTLKNSPGVVMVVAMLIMLAVVAVGIGMITSAAMSSTIAKNYRSKLQSFYAADGMMTVLSQAVIDSQMSNWTGTLGTTLYIGATPPTGVSPSAKGILKADTSGFTTGWQIFTPSATATHWYSNVLNGTYSAGTWIDSLTYTEPSGSGIMEVDLYQTASDGTSPTQIGTAAQLTCTGTGHNLGVLSTTSASSIAFSNQRLRLSITLVSGSAPNVCYGTKAFNNHEGPCLTPPTFSAAPCTVTVGNFYVFYTIAGNAGNPNDYTINVRSLQLNSKWGSIFETPLTQDIDRSYGGGFTTPGATAEVAVTYYDFHSDRTNPEFEQPCTDTNNKNMVGTFLDSDRKPVCGPDTVLCANIAKWFRPWKSRDTLADTIIPVYHNTTLQYTTVDSSACGKTLKRWRRCSPFEPWDCPVNNGTSDAGKAGCSGEWGNASASEVEGSDNFRHPIFERTSPPNDTSFKNIMFNDSLTFTLVNAATGTYKYDQSGFWPLDGRGFGAEWAAAYQKTNDTFPDPDTSKTHLPPGVWPHNFAFTMTMSRTFVKTPNDTFYFIGDDDIWLFLNNRLVMDLGGPHENTATNGQATVLIDTCFKHTGALGALVPADTMVNYQTYNFDFFYAERHSSNSDIKITTNILFYFPAQSQRRSYQRSYGNIN